ncbi:MAG: nucleotidyltransferase family protein [Acidobacteria bacterium]|nr:nucleotidyltransferase family protein [Acidobacteriota bacterium]
MHTLREQSLVVAAKDQVSCDLAGEAAILGLRDGVYYGLDLQPYESSQAVHAITTTRPCLESLIEKRGLRRATALLDSEGYAIDPQLTAAQLSSHLRFDCEISLVHQESGCVVDLHWGLAPKRFHFALNPGDLFQRLQTIALGNNTLRTFSNEDLVVFLCMHGAKHLWVRLEWISSLAELIRNSEGINWVTVVQNARRSHSLRRLLLGLMLAKDLQPELHIPAPVFAAVPDCESLQRCAERLRERIFQIKSEKEDQTEIFLFHLIAMDRKLDAVIGLLRSMLLPTVSDWRFVTLPDALYPLYYVLRPLRLAAQFISTLGKRIRSRKRSLMKSSPLP